MLTKSSPLATKSVSQFTSTITARAPSALATATLAPSAATRPADLSALAMPVLRISSTAASMSPPGSGNAFLHSIMPDPVRSRSSFTSAAVISFVLSSRSFFSCLVVSLFLRVVLLLRRGALGLLHDPLDRLLIAALDLGRGALIHLDELVAGRGLQRGRMAVDHRIGRTAHVDLNRARGVVVAGDDVVDIVRAVVGIDHADHRDAQGLGLGHRDLLMADVDHQQRVGETRHVLDAAQAALEFFELAREAEGLFLAKTLEAAVLLHGLEVLQATDGLTDGLEVGEHAAQPALVHVG